jgi:hypothetical protein
MMMVIIVIMAIMKATIGIAMKARVTMEMSIGVGNIFIAVYLALGFLTFSEPKYTVY